MIEIEAEIDIVEEAIVPKANLDLAPMPNVKENHLKASPDPFLKLIKAEVFQKKTTTKFQIKKVKVAKKNDDDHDLNIILYIFIDTLISIISQF